MYLFTCSLGCFSVKTQRHPLSLHLPQKLLSEFAKEAGRWLRLQEGPKHNLKPKARTQCGSNIEEHGEKELPIHGFYVG